MRVRALALLVAVAAAAACGDSQNPGSPPSPGTPETIRGTERLGWDQQAGSGPELATFQYAIYVDGNRTALADVACAPTAASAGFACSGRLPAMNPGQHTLELAAFQVDGATIIESPRSPPLRVNVSPASLAPDAATTPAGEPIGPARRGTGVRAATIANGFADVTDLARDHDGRLLVAERNGAVRLVREGAVHPRPALLVGDQIVSLALDPSFARTRFIYVLQAGDGRGGETVLRLVRYREVGGAFGERAILRDDMLVDSPAGVVRVGPGRRIFVASSDDAAAAQGRGEAHRGRLVRLEADGRTPASQVRGPVFVDGINAPRGLDWHPRTQTLWLADAAPGLERLLVVMNASGPAEHPRPVSIQTLTAGTGVHGLTFYRGEALSALRESLLVAADSGLWRVRFDPRDATRVAAIDDLVGEPVRAVVAGADGRVFAATASRILELQQDGGRPSGSQRK